MESLEARIRQVTQEAVAIVPYDPLWPQQFVQEKTHLLACLPADVLRRIEHFGSTAVPGMAAKPVIDMLVEVSSLEAVKARVVPVLEAQGYEYFWRPTRGEDGGPFYAWFIKRGPNGVRTHHIHMVEAGFTKHWDRLLFRDYLARHLDVAREYEALKYRVAAVFAHDRVAYTRAKTAFIDKVTEKARRDVCRDE